MTAPVPTAVLGTSGHAREVVWIAGLDDSVHLLGCVGPRDGSRGRVPATWLGTDDWLDEAPPEVGYVIGIGDGRIRERLAGRDSVLARTAPKMVHPSAVIGAAINLGDGSVVWPGAVLTTDITTGSHVHICTNVAVGHDVILSDYVTLLPGCTIGGHTQLGHGVTVGAGASILEGLQIGAGAMVGAGALVREDVASGSVVVGVPARHLRTIR